MQTRQSYALKVINKKLIHGKENMVKNEIAVLKRTAGGHPSIMGLHDYFETKNDIYLCFDLCTGGTLADPIRNKTHYYESDVISIIRTILAGVKYLHAMGIVHRDLKPDNVLFASRGDDSKIIIGDFGLSRLLESSKLSLLTHCGTLAYMAPEIFRNIGYGAAVDVWAIGVFAFFLICGHSPFDIDSQQLCVEAILTGDYTFEPPEVWNRVSDAAKDFIGECLVIDPINRPTASVALRHEWLKEAPVGVVPKSSPKLPDLYPYVAKAFGKSLKQEPPLFSIGIMDLHATSPLALLRGDPGASANELLEKFKRYIDESEKGSPADTVLVDDMSIDGAIEQADHVIQVKRLGTVNESQDDRDD